MVQVNNFCKFWKFLYNIKEKKGGQQPKLPTYYHILSLIVFDQGCRLTHAGEGRLSENVFAVWTAVLVFIFGHYTLVGLAPSSSSLCELGTLYSFSLCIVKRRRHSVCLCKKQAIGLVVKANHQLTASAFEELHNKLPVSDYFGL